MPRSSGIKTTINGGAGGEDFDAAVEERISMYHFNRERMAKIAEQERGNPEVTRRTEGPPVEEGPPVLGRGLSTAERYPYGRKN